MYESFNKYSTFGRILFEHNSEFNDTDKKCKAAKEVFTADNKHNSKFGSKTEGLFKSVVFCLNKDILCSFFKLKIQMNYLLKDETNWNVTVTLAIMWS